MMKSSIRALTNSLALAPKDINKVITSVAAVCFRRARRFDTQRVATFALLAVVMTAAADPAFAQSAGGQGDITSFLQNLVNIITGTAGKIIAVLAVCIVGIGAMMGALSMRAAGSVVLGVCLVFASGWIVNTIIGQ